MVVIGICFNVFDWLVGEFGVELEYFFFDYGELFGLDGDIGCVVGYFV